MHNDNKLSHRQQGFTLVELMVALVIFIVIMLGLLRGEISALSTQSGNLYRDEALRLAEDELSRLKGELYSVASTSNALTQRLWPASPAVEPDCSAVPTGANCPTLTVRMRSGNVSFVRTTQLTTITINSIEMKRIDVAVGWNQGNSTTILAPTNGNHQATLSTVIVRAD